ncbi:hypothetical protein FUAX_29090 [Fulvitalea axinellae]|uniref:YbbR-like domain-containing protein n=1 Tax=Fulvitalea axinellae TaxID=1182444 RepID=A0AAU9CYD1_9BACT|nr:hypothetical protein FUAX_29090 [Fulvitalea axinellae]
MKNWKNILPQIKRFLRYLAPADKERLKIMIMCFVTATIFWFFNALNKDYRTDITYPISFEYENPEEYTVVEPLPENMTVQIKGRGWRLLSLVFDYDPEPFPIILTAPDEIKTQNTAPLMQSIKNFFKERHDIFVDNIMPTAFQIDIETRVERKLPAYVDPSTLKLGKNIRLKGVPTVTPKLVSVTGPDKYVNSLPDSIAISLSDQTIEENFDENVPIEIPNSDWIETYPSKVKVRIEVYTVASLQHRAVVVPVNFPYGYKLATDITWLSYTIPKDHPDRLSDQDFIVEADFRKMLPDSTIRPELVQFPSGVESVKLDTMRLKVIHLR